MRVTLQPAFILHHRLFRESSLLLDVFTEEYGRVSLVARGVRSKRSALKAILQPFMPLFISWQGKHELMTLVAAEAQGAPLSLHGDCLLSGFYINELLVRVLQKQDPYPMLFSTYQQTLEALTIQPLDPKVLRIFEKKLLEQIGYGLQLRVDSSTGQPLLPHGFYQYCHDQGFAPVDELSPGGFRGECLLALADETLVTDEHMRDAKRLMRVALAPLLGAYGVQSRELFKK